MSELHRKSNRAREIDLRIEYPCKECGTSGMTMTRVCEGRVELHVPCYACVGTGIEPERIA